MMCALGNVQMKSSVMSWTPPKEQHTKKKTPIKKWWSHVDGQCPTASNLKAIAGSTHLNLIEHRSTSKPVHRLSVGRQLSAGHNVRWELMYESRDRTITCAKQQINGSQRGIKCKESTHKGSSCKLIDGIPKSAIQVRVALAKWAKIHVIITISKDGGQIDQIKNKGLYRWEHCHSLIPLHRYQINVTERQSATICAIRYQQWPKKIYNQKE